MRNLDNIKQTIKNLRARAADAGSTETEVMASISLAERKMKENDLTLKDLEEQASSGEIVTRSWTKGKQAIHPVQYVLNAISNLTETRVWVRKDHNETMFQFMGFDQDVEYALYLVDLIHNAMESEWGVFKAGDAYTQTPPKQRRRMREDFMRGMATRIREKVVAMVAEKRVQTEDIAAAGTSIVVAKRQMISAEMGKTGVEPRKPRLRKKKVGETAYTSGMRAGERTNVTTGIGEHV